MFIIVSREIISMPEEIMIRPVLRESDVMRSVKSRNASTFEICFSQDRHERERDRQKRFFKALESELDSESEQSAAGKISSVANYKIIQCARYNVKNNEDLTLEIYLGQYTHSHDGGPLESLICYREGEEYLKPLSGGFSSATVCCSVFNHTLDPGSGNTNEKENSLQRRMKAEKDAARVLEELRKRVYELRY